MGKAIRNFKKSDNIKLPAVHKVHLEFDKEFISKCLKKRRATDINAAWPELLKAMHGEAEKCENELSHIESCCRVARERNVTPYKDKLWEMLLLYNRKDI